MTIVFAARHAPVEGLASVCAGRFEVNAALSPQAAWGALSEGCPSEPVTAVWTSPLSRCATLALHVAEVLGVPHRTDERLLEISYGQWEGRTWAEVQQSDPEAVSTWLDRWEVEGPPGGEAAREVEARVRAWWGELDAGRHVLIAHGGVVRALRVLVLRRSWPEAMTEAVPHLRWERFERPR